MTYRADVDGLRAVAVLGVIVYHATPGAAPGGFAGVDVFFVISGFLITGILLDAMERGKLSAAEFYARRVRRLFPPLALVLAGVLAFGWFALLADEYASLGKHAAAGAGFVSNLVSWSEVGYWDRAAATKPLIHLWSLGIEEQFYLVWPLVLWLAWRARKVALVTSVLLVGSLAVAVFYAQRGDGAAAFYAPHARLWELLAGALLAHYRPRPEGRRAEAYAAAGLLAIAASFALGRGGPAVVAWVALAVAGSAALIAAGERTFVARAVLARPAMAWLGRASFPLYLWHWPLLVLLRMLEGETPPLGHRLAVLVLALALAAVTHHAIERPARRGGRTLALALCLGLAVIGLLGYQIHARDGLPGRAVQQDAPKFAIYSDMVSPGCITAHPYARGGGCHVVADPRGTILVLGDSHARSLAPALVAETLPAGLLVITRPGCTPFESTEYVDVAGRTPLACRGVIEGALHDAETDPRISTVVLVGRFAYRATLLGIGDEPDDPGHIEYDDGTVRTSDPAEAFERGFARTLERLARAGRRIVLVDQVPELAFDPRSCVPRPFGLGRADRARCIMPRADVELRQRPYRAIVERVLARASPQVRALVRRVDPMELLCDATTCHVWRGDELLYYDDDHLGSAGAALLSHQIAAALSRP